MALLVPTCLGAQSRGESSPPFRPIVSKSSAMLSMFPLTAVQTYRGISDGWQTVAVRAPEEAVRLYSLLNRVRPDWTHRLKPVLLDGTLL